MEFGTKIMNDSFGIIPTKQNTNNIRDENYMRYVGWSETDICSDGITGTQRFFSQDTVNVIFATLDRLDAIIHDTTTDVVDAVSDDEGDLS